jgi:hypothetical protein
MSMLETTMSGRQETAKIYQFPLKARLGGRQPLNLRLSPDQRQPLPVASLGAGWYHDRAIQDAEPPRK